MPHTSQLRQAGDYLKNNKAKASPPRVHMFTTGLKQKVEIKFFQRENSCLLAARENSSRQQIREFTNRHRKKDSCTQSMSESRHTRTRLERDVNREQHRSSDKSYGTTGGQQNQPGATTMGNGPSYESYSRTTQDQGRCHRVIHTTTWHHQPRLVCTRSLQH